MKKKESLEEDLVLIVLRMTEKKIKKNLICITKNLKWNKKKEMESEHELEHEHEREMENEEEMEMELRW